MKMVVIGSEVRESTCSSAALLAPVSQLQTIEIATPFQAPTHRSLPPVFAQPLGRIFLRTAQVLHFLGPEQSLPLASASKAVDLRLGYDCTDAW